MVPVLVVATLVAFLLLDVVILRARRRRTARVLAQQPVRAISEEAVIPPAGLFLGEGGTWLALRSAGGLRVGGRALLLKALGRPDAVELPKAGVHVQRGDVLFTVRVGERAARFRAPVSGRVTAVNFALDDRPEWLHERPFEAWAVELAPDGLAAEVSSMGVAERARDLVRKEYEHFKDMLVALTSSSGAMQMATGGEPVEGVLRHLDDKAWASMTDEFLTVR